MLVTCATVPIDSNRGVVHDFSKGRTGSFVRFRTVLSSSSNCRVPLGEESEILHPVKKVVTVLQLVNNAASRFDTAVPRRVSVPNAARVRYLPRSLSGSRGTAADQKVLFFLPVLSRCFDVPTLLVTSVTEPMQTSRGVVHTLRGDAGASVGRRLLGSG